MAKSKIAKMDACWRQMIAQGMMRGWDYGRIRTGLEEAGMAAEGLPSDDSIRTYARSNEYRNAYFEREQRSYLTIAIGCTGGRHRSVAVAGRLAESLSAMGHQVTLKHRDIHKS